MEFIASRLAMKFMTPPPTDMNQGGLEGFRNKRVGQPSHIAPSVKLPYWLVCRTTNTDRNGYSSFRRPCVESLLFLPS